MDEQTLSGKLPLVVARRSAPVPVVAVVGHNALPVDRLPEHHIAAIHALSGMTDKDSAADPELSAALLATLGRHIIALPHRQGPHPPMRRAKIVATFGPAIEQLRRDPGGAGGGRGRGPAEHEPRRPFRARADLPPRPQGRRGTGPRRSAIFADLQGPKIRLGRFADGPHHLAEGQRFTITIEDVEGTAEICSTTYRDCPGTSGRATRC